MEKMAAAAGSGSGTGRAAAARPRPGPARFRGCLAGALLGDCLGAVFEGRSVVKLSDLLRFLRGLEPTSGPPEEGEQAGSARRGGPKHRERDGGRPPEHIPFPGPTESGPAPQHPRDRALGCLSSPPRSTTPPGPPPLRNVGAPSPAPHLTEGRLLWDTHGCPPPPRSGVCPCAVGFGFLHTHPPAGRG